MRTVLPVVALITIFTAVAVTQTSAPVAASATTASAPATMSSSYPSNPLPLPLDQVKKLAESGNVIAMVDMGDAYASGYGVTIDRAEAQKWYRQASQAGNAEATMSLLGILTDLDVDKQPFDELKALASKGFGYASKNAALGQAREMYWLATFYEHGMVGAKHDMQKFQEIIKSSADAGNYWAARDLFKAYASGECGAVDLSAAETWREKGIALVKKSLDDGDTRALVLLVEFYEEPGKGQDKQKAFEYAQKGANLKYARLMYKLAGYYKKGFGVERDMKEYVKWLGEAAKQGFSTAMSDLAKVYAEGIYVPKDEKKAEELYLKAVDSGDFWSRFSLARIYVAKDQQDKADQCNAKIFAIVERSVKLNIYPGMFLGEMAMCYQVGVGVKEDPAKAVELYTQSAELGDGSSLLFLGRMYISGNGVEADVSKGIEYIEQAAEKRINSAMIDLGHFYRLGRGVTKDVDIALEWYEKAANNGSDDALTWIGRTHAEKGDSSKAMDYYRQAAQMGSTSAMVNVGYLYFYGDGVDKDEKEGMKWFQAAAEDGDGFAMNFIGQIFEGGQSESFAKSTRLAFEWYTKSADRGDERGMLNLARCYAEGIGTKEDLKKSLEWCKKAAQMGNKVAAKMVRKIEAQIKESEKQAEDSAPASAPASRPASKPATAKAQE